MNAYDKMNEAAAGTAIATADLVGQVFIVEDTRSVETEFGQRYIAIVRWPPESDEIQEAWMSGVILSRQVDAIKNDLPLVVKLTRNSKPNSPYILVEPTDEEKPIEEADSPLVARAKAAGAKEIGRIVLTKVRLKDVGDMDMDWAVFIGKWEEEGFQPVEIGEICGATSARAVTHYFALNKKATVGTLKEEALRRRQINEATKARKPLAEIPFE